MSFALLKNLVFRQPKQQVYNKIEAFEGQSWASSPTLSSENSDVESQQLRDEISEKLPPPSQKVEPSRFKVDARVISDAIIGLSDGLTVPFALTAGLSAIGSTKVVVYGGMAELIAGAISMGLGGYLGAKSERDSYNATLHETEDLVNGNPAAIEETITSLFESYDVPEPTIRALTSHLATSPHLTSFMMRFEHTLPEPVGSRAITCALTIAMGYFMGGFLPLLPYFFVDGVRRGLAWSVGIMIIALFSFGYTKTCFVSGWKGWRKSLLGVRGGVEMVVVGSLAAGAAMGLVIAFNNHAGALG
ncbi:DUF125-domain-containing protein [Mollisia scopiformis]|uniref:DUF125-domain-containing protein n=1 Tax=Mollisia scopiformis TaxID=149040 RepID=A0A132B5E8_MOLSC|nr:DUF125-domain-containing protein [Mollisia scopiformis]KUJ07638.1 DUF125-domain-containing protein [Mollisia scopiformis]